MTPMKALERLPFTLKSPVFQQFVGRSRTHHSGWKGNDSWDTTMKKAIGPSIDRTAMVAPDDV